MKVKDICTRTVKTCAPGSTLADAGWAMWEGDCGILPILDETGKVVGVITDRDIAIATATKFRPAAQIAVREAATLKAHTCKPGDEVRDALRTMRQERVRRLPVVDVEGSLRGLLSLNDIALAVVPEKSAKSGDVSYEDLALAMKAVCAHRPAPAEGSRQESTRALSVVKSP